MAVPADNGRTFNHDPILDHRALANEYPLTNERDAFAVVVQPGVEVSVQVGLNLLQRIPGIFAAVKDRRMRRLAEIE